VKGLAGQAEKESDMTQTKLTVAALLVVFTIAALIILSTISMGAVAGT
jgi:hypothetical protein